MVAATSIVAVLAASAFGAPFPHHEAPSGVYDTDEACQSACTQVCVGDEATGATHCVSATEAALREADYGCVSSCDGDCRRTATGVACFTGTAAFAQTALRLRAAPSTEAAVKATLPAGTPLSIGRRQAPWLHVGEGWVHGDFVADRWVGPPDPSAGYGIDGWPVARSADGRALFEVVDIGNMGAVDGPLLVLCRRPLPTGEPTCLRRDGKPGPTSAPSELLAHLWNEHGTDVQRFLADAVPAELVAVSEAASGLQLTRDTHGILAIREGEREVWTTPDPQGARGHLRGLHRMGDTLLLALVLRPLEGCCEEQVGRAVVRSSP